MPFVYVQNPTGGVFAGDRLTTRIDAGPGTRVHLTTPAATRVHRMDGGSAEQLTELEIGESAYVESIPEPIVPQAGSRLRSRVAVTLAANASFVGAELVTPGRVARGEVFDYGLVELETSITDATGRRLCTDRIVLEPGRRAPAARGLLAGPSYLCTVVALAPGHDTEALAAAVDERLSERVGTAAAAGTLPHGAGIVARGLAPSLPVALVVLDTVWSYARRQLLGAPPPPRRK